MSLINAIILLLQLSLFFIIPLLALYGLAYTLGKQYTKHHDNKATTIINELLGV